MITPNGYNSFNIISIDPGSINTGVSIIHVEADVITSIDARTIEVLRLYNDSGYDTESQPEKIIRLAKLANKFIDIVDRYKPIAVVCEAPFYNRKFPMAFGTLLTILNNFQTALAYYNPNIMFATLEPLVIKSLVHARSNQGKQPMKDAIMQIHDIMSVLIPNIHDLDEHSIDAIAIGYGYLRAKGL